MTTYTAVLPFVWRPYRDAFMRRCKLEILEVDNTIENIGIMRAHNLGIDEMKRTDSDWLIIMSAALRFGKSGGLDFVEQLEAHSGHHVIEAAGVYGWHLIAFSRETIDRIGRWDANFSPYGFCDLDMSIRYQNAFNRSGQLWDKVPVDVHDKGMAHSLKFANVQADANPRISYFKAKWGRHPGSWQERPFRWPFNNPTNPVGYWPPVKGDAWDR